MKTRKKIPKVLKYLRIFTISQIVRETWNLDKAGINWEKYIAFL